MKHQKTINGKIYVPVVLKVVKSDDEGPRQFEMVRFDETVHLRSEVASISGSFMVPKN